MSPNPQKGLARRSMAEGFIALFTVIIVSFTLLLLAITTNFSSITSRVNIYGSENKARSVEVAFACIEHVRLMLVINPTLVDSNEKSIGTDICNYEVSGGEIITYSDVNGANTFFWAEVNTGLPKIPIINFKECADLSPCP